LFVNRPGAQQATVRFQCLLPKVTAESWPSRVVLRTQIWSSLRRALREDLGSSYDVGSRLDFFGGGNNTLTISTDVDYPLLPEALRRLRATLGAGGPGSASASFDPAARARTVLTGDLRTTQDWAHHLLNKWALSWPLDLRDRLADGVAALHPGELQALADHCSRNGVVGLMGDEPRLRAAWREAGAATP
jgi:hypothetical protein